MKDQHEKITGYRDLTQEEIDMMNEGKTLAETVGRWIQGLEELPLASGDPNFIDQRWVAIGKTHLQQGFMAAIRGIAKPTTF